jgi:predicted permease
MPTGANAFLLARRAEGLLEMSAAKVLLTTLLSIASLTALLHLLA